MRTTIRENEFEETYIDNWMKAQPRVIKGKAREVKRGAFYHEAIALHAKYSLQDQFAQVTEAEFKRLHDIINQLTEENEHLKFQIMANMAKGE
ncbi:conserved hypothetical protein [Burkholderia cenocepacia]|nr:conserved hypothetical protein [Burkholderia cenocepacia]